VNFWQSTAFLHPRELPEIARLAEEVGFYGALLSDHLVCPETIESAYPYSPDGKPPFGPDSPWPEPWSTISAMAAVTSHLRFATNVYILPLRDPIEVAKATSTVAAISGDRLALGAGAGWMKEEFETLGRDFHTRGRRFDEMIEVLRKLWQGEMVEHHGEFFDFGRLQMSPAPGAPIPIYIGGASEAALRRAARLGDGWIGAGNPPDEIPGILDRLSALRREVGRDQLPFEVMVALTTPPDVDRFRRLEDQGVTSIVSWPLSYVLGPDATPDDRRRVIERYGDEIIARAK
jgi:probable F420-dependent oxidoreductase